MTALRAPEPAPAAAAGRANVPDRAWAVLLTILGLGVLLVAALIVAELSRIGAPALGQVGVKDFVTKSTWDPTRDLFGAAPPAECQGRSFLREGDRQAVIFGYFGGAVNVTDGMTSYHRFPADVLNQEIYQYTLMPTHITARFTPSWPSACATRSACRCGDAASRSAIRSLQPRPGRSIRIVR